MPKMRRSELKSMLSAQKQSALAAVHAAKLSNERSDALMYYMGDMTKDLPAPDGRSQAVSSDVADTIEGLMPGLMEIFAGSDEVLEFNPVGPEDVPAARQETDYINNVFMQQNPGFLVLYSFIKDALLSKVGVVKVWWETRQEEENETYYDLTDEQFAILSADDEVEIVEHSEKPVELPPEQLAMLSQVPKLHDVKVTKAKTFGECKVLGVPPEEFGIEPSARSIPSCNYCFHAVLKTEDELIQQGYDKQQVKDLPTYATTNTTEEISRDSVDENQQAGEEYNQAARKIQITEHYVRMDYKGDGKACLYRVTTDEQGDVLRRDGEDDIIEFDVIPFAAMTPVIVTHRFFGRSIADLVMDIQRIKTALLRALLDNAYLANNPRVVVSETGASDNTLDDLLISRPGGIVRTKTTDAVTWQSVPTIGNHVYPLLEYMDTQREMRTGVTRQGQGLDPETLQDQSATAVSQMFTLAQARMRLIARIFAETGVKDLFLLIHATERKHGQQKKTVRLLNNWVEIDPRQWKKRADMTVNVGLGHGGKAEQMAMANVIAMYQEKALAGGLTNLVTPQNLYNTAKMLTRIAGHKDVNSFFTDPATQPPLQPQPDPKLIELQMKNEIEKTQAQADIAVQNIKTQAEIALAERKFELERELKILEAQIKQNEHQQDIQLKVLDHESKQQERADRAEESKKPKASIEVKHDAGEVTGPIGEAIAAFGSQMAQLHQSMAENSARQGDMIAQAVKHLSAPKRIVRDDRGKISHTEAVL